MPPRDKSWSCSTGKSWTLWQNEGFCSFSVSKLFTHMRINQTLSIGLIDVKTSLFWSWFYLHLLSRSFCHNASKKMIFLIFLHAPPTFKYVAFYQSNSLAAAKKSSSSAIKQAAASTCCCFALLILSRPVFPCGAVQLFVLMGLLKPVPRYPLSQHQAASHGTRREAPVSPLFFC